MPKSKCTICGSPDRAEIENAILSMTSSSNPEDRKSIEDIAEEFEISLNDLKMHALFHTPMVHACDLEPQDTADESSEEDKKPTDSLTRKMKLREADMLAQVNNEYLVTLKAMGRRLNKMIQVDPIDQEDIDKQFTLSKLLTKPMVDLYVGVGNEIRHNVKTMAELERMLNGPQDSTGGGLMALAQAIRGSDSNG